MTKLHFTNKGCVLTQILLLNGEVMYEINTCIEGSDIKQRHTRKRRDRAWLWRWKLYKILIP